MANNHNNHNRIIDLTSSANRRLLSTGQYVFDLTSHNDEETSSSVRGGKHRPKNSNHKRSRTTVTHIDDDDEDDYANNTTLSTSSSSSTTTTTSRNTSPKQTQEQKINAALHVLEDAINGTLLSDTKSSKSSSKGGTNNGNGLGVTRTYVMNKLISFIPCPICLGNPITTLTSTKCGHVFCKTCIEGAIQATKKCAVCNTPLKPKEIHPLYL